MIWFLLYLWVAVLVVYPVTHAVAHDCACGQPPEMGDWVPAVAAGTLAAVIWPVLLFGFAAFMVSRRIWAGTWRLRWPSSMREDAGR